MRSDLKLDGRFVLGLLLWSQAIFIASTFRNWYVVMSLTALSTALVVLRDWTAGGESASSQRGLPRWARWILCFVAFLFCAGLVALGRLGSQVGEEINFIFVSVDILAHAALVANLMVWVLHPRRGHVSMLPLGLIVVLLAVAAGGASVSLAAQTTVALATCLAFTIGAQIILGSERSPGGLLLARDRNADRSAWLSTVFSWLALSVLMMGTSAIANATSLVLPTIQNRLQEQLKASLDSVGEQSVVGGTRYVRGGRLGAIRQHMVGNPREVALQVYANVPPGYLRGNAFDTYRGGRWMDSGSLESLRFRSGSGVHDRSVAPSGDGSTLLHRSGKSGLQRFSLVPSSPQPVVSLEIHNDPMKGPMVFLPLATHWLEARSRELSVSSHGIIRMGVDVTRPYVAGVGFALPREELSETTRQSNLQVSDAVLPLVRATARRVCGGAATANGKAAAVSRYFQTEYGYSLSHRRSPRGVDPVSYFLQTKHDAHCEFFATATALMLRSVGVPARYVTGYIVDESSEDESGLWLARNQDAHAWVEAFDDSTGRWFAVESTPGRTYRTIEPETEADTSVSMLSGLLDATDDENDWWLSRLVGWFASMRVSEPLLVLFRFTQLPLFLFLVYLLWSRYLKPRSGGVDQTEYLSRKMLRQADRKMRKFALVRRPSETLYQFAERIERAATDPEYPQRTDTAGRLSQTAKWYRDYADARYQGQLPEALT